MSESDSSSDVEIVEPPTKTRKLQGAAKYLTKFNPDWNRNWPCIQPSSVPFKFKCTICECQVSCEHQGEKDVRRHLDSKKHNDNIKALDQQQKVTQFFKSTADPIHEKVTRAEVKVCTVLAHHNIPIALSDHLSPLFKDIFSDSQIAKMYSCARTKSACIINGALAKELQGSLIQVMKHDPFSLATDGSNDSGLQKMNPLTVRIFDANRGCVTTRFLDMCLTSASTAEAIFSKIDETLKKHDLDWSRCVSFGVDNTSVNMGKHNSIKTRVQQKNSAVYFMGCPCHMVHNTAIKAAGAFESVTGFDVEDMMVDLYYWFDKSTKRKNELAEFCNFCDTQYREVVKHVSTRWLSLEIAIERALKQYSPLKSYFLSSDTSQVRFRRLKALFEDPLNEVYLMFYQSVLPLFTSLNKFLQRETPCIHWISDKLEGFIVNIVGKFLTIEVIKKAKHDRKLLDIDFRNPDNQVSYKDLCIGFTTKQKLQKLLNDGDISEQQFKTFYQAAFTFFTTAIQYALDTYPLKDELLLHSKCVDFENRASVNFSSIEYFIHRYPHLESFRDPKVIELLQQQFISYQLLEDSDIPVNIWEEATVKLDDETSYKRIDVIWNYIFKMQITGSSELKFAKLKSVIQSVLVIPNSNAAEERVFSLIRKNKTPFRPSLGLEGTLSSIVGIKLGIDDPCERYEPSKQVLNDAKKATWEYNKTHLSKKH